MFCGKCGKEVKNTVAFCPFCGNEIPKEREQPTYKEAVVDRESREEAQEKKVKKTVPWKLVWNCLAVGIGVLCLVTIGVVGYQQIVKMKNNQTKENGTQAENVKDTTGKDLGKQDNWQLFQTEASVIPLTDEEQKWLQNIFELYGKNAKKAMYEENMLSFQVLPATEKEGNIVTAYAVMEEHSLKMLEYVDKISYIKIQFNCQKEPELETIKVWTAKPGSNKYTKAKASSVLAAQHNNASADREICTYEAKNVTDGDNTTAWIEGKKGFGKGASITLSEANNESHSIYGFCIKNGFTKTQRTLERNAQVKEVEVSFPDGNTTKYALQKNIHTSYRDDWYSDCIIFQKAVKGKNVKFKIRDTYSGKDYYEYIWEHGKGSGYKKVFRESCEDTCISEIIILDDPQMLDYKEETVSWNQEYENPSYDSWEQAYAEQIRNLDGLMEKYKESIQLYLDVPNFMYTSLEYFYDTDGKLYPPTDGFLQDLDEDQIPELCLYKAIGDDTFLMHMAHVFSVDEENHLLYCGSFFFRPDEENKTIKPIVIDVQSGGLDVLLCDAEIYGSYEYNTYLVENKKLKQTQSIVSEQTSESIGDIRNYRKNGTSMDKKGYDTYVSERQNREEIVSYDMNELLNTLEGE